MLIRPLVKSIVNSPKVILIGDNTDMNLFSNNQQNSSSIPILNLTDMPLIGQIQTPFYGVLSAEGGIEPYTYNIWFNTLPTGLILDSTTGIISGTPSIIGNYEIGVEVCSNGQCDQELIIISIIQDLVTVTVED